MSADHQRPGYGTAFLDILKQIDILWLEAALRAGGHAMRVDCFTIAPLGAALADEPAWMGANVVSGLKRLPIIYRVGDAA